MIKEIDYAVYVKKIRKRLNMTQAQFADFLTVSKGNICDWEQGRRNPSGAAKVLLRIADKHPTAIFEIHQKS